MRLLWLQGDINDAMRHVVSSHHGLADLRAYGVAAMAYNRCEGRRRKKKDPKSLRVLGANILKPKVQILREVEVVQGKIQFV